MKQKLFTLLLAVAASVGTLFAWDYERVQIGDLYYNLDATNQTAEVTSQNSKYPYWSNTITTANIPSSVEYNSVTYSVTSIGEDAFFKCSRLTSIEIPNGVTSIGGEAFYGCSGLTGDLIIPNSVTSIGEKAFYQCKGLTSVTIPNSVTSIGSSAFWYCTGLTSVTIPNSVTSIGSSAFYNCRGLTSVTIPNSVTSIGERAFEYCSGLTAIDVAADNPNYCAEEGVLFSKDKTTLVAYPGGKQGAYSIPNGVTSIGGGAFYQCSGLTGDLIIPNSVTSIGEKAFYQCKGLTSVTIPNSVTCIGEEAFSYCSGLTSVIIPNSVTSIGESAFQHCRAITEVTIGSGLIALGKSVFNDCTAIELVHWNAVNYHQQKPDLDSNCFPFYSSKDNISTFVFGDSVTYIPAYLLKDFSRLESIIIPAGVTEIGEYAFSGCYNLTSVTVEAETPPTLGNNVLDGSNCNIYIPCGTLETYQVAEGWSEYASQIKYVSLPYTIATQAKNGNVTTTDVTTLTVCDPSVICTAIANYGYHFVLWSDSVTDNPRTIWLTQDTTFTAEFAKNTYTISTTSANPGWGTTAGDTAALYLEEVEISAIPNYGYHFVRWNDNNTSNPRIVSVTENKTYTATFAKNVYSITQKAEHGSISGNSTAEYLDEVTLTVSSDYGYHFSKWSDGNTDNPRTIVLTQDTTFTAEFAKNTYTISTTSANPGWGTTAGDTAALYLEEVEISAIPNYGYHFVRWNDNNTSNPRIVSVTEDKTYIATFAKNVYSIATNAEHGSISGNSSAEYLDVVELIAEPNHGYHFVQWSDGNTDNPRTFIVTQDTTFTAIFAQTFSGPCGDNLYWEYADDKLTFTGSGDMYEYSDMYIPWSLFTQSVRSIDFAAGMNSISAYAYQGMTNIHKVNLPSSIETIGDYAFAGCTGIKALSIPNNVTSLGAGAFEGCYNIDSLIVGTGVTFITDQFSGCTGLRYLQLSQNMQKVGSGAFIDAERLNYIVCHAKYPPVAYADKGTQLRSFYNMNARVLVPCDNFEDYEVDALWGSFNLKCLSSESGTAVDGQVTVIPGDADATFTWPTDGTAETYNLEITKEGVVFCTLTFNSQGQLLGIHFAPSRDGKLHQMPSANLTTNGMTFQVTGLDYASQYRFSFETKNATQTIFAYTGAFITNGAQGDENVQVDVENVQVDSEIPTKVLIDGQIYILRGDKTYTIQGQEVR